MSIISDIGNLIRGKAQSVADSLQGVDTLAESVADLERRVTAAENALLEQRTTAVLKDNEVRALEEEVNAWEKDAKQAVAKGNDALATQALQRRQQEEIKLKAARTQLDDLNAAIAAADANLARVREELNNRRNGVEAARTSVEAAHAKELIAGVAGVGNEANSQRAARVAAANINRQVAHADVAMATVDAQDGSALRRAIHAEAQSDSIAEQLAKLKQGEKL